MASSAVWMLVAAVCCGYAAGQTAPAAPINETDFSISQLVTQYGYPFQSFNVTTSDGFVLTIFRIPRGRGQGATTTSRPVVLFQNGFEDSAISWVINGPTQSAPFLFADAGYDVWLGNVRGSRFGRFNTKFGINSTGMWKWTWSEMIPNDIETVGTYVQKTAGAKTIYLVGHGQGATVMLGKLARNPNFARIIKQCFVIGATTTLRNMRGGFRAIGNAYFSKLNDYYNKVGDVEVTVPVAQMKYIANNVCTSPKGQEFCERFARPFIGSTSIQLNTSRIASWVAHQPGGTSLRNVVHWNQMIRSGNLAQFDYGLAGNRQNYNSDAPPEYDLTEINTPVQVFFSNEDWVSSRGDTLNFLLGKLNKQIMIKPVELSGYNHMDWILGLRAANDVYNPIIKTIGADFSSK